MKKLVFLIVCMLMTVSVTGCATDDLAAYLKAMDATNDIETGEEYFEMALEVEYNKEGLTDDELKTLSYFDVVRFIMTNQIETIDDTLHVASNVYYNLGGMGLDMKIYVDGDQVYMKMPVRDEYIDLSDQMQGEEGMSEEDSKFVEIIQPLIDAWKTALEQDDIIKGKNTYIMSESGQIKATTYDITIDKEQLQYLSDVLVESITEEGAIEYFIGENNSDLSADEVVEVADTFNESLENASISYFNSTAFVDFDGRMVRQTFDFEIDFGEVESGQMQYVKGSFIMEYSELGQPQNIVYPNISPDQWVEMDDDGTYYEDLFPEGIFED